MKARTTMGEWQIGQVNGRGVRVVAGMIMRNTICNNVSSRV